MFDVRRSMFDVQNVVSSSASFRKKSAILRHAAKSGIAFSTLFVAFYIPYFAGLGLILPLINENIICFRTTYRVL